MRDLQQIVLSESIRVRNEVIAEKEKEVQVGAFHNDLNSNWQRIRGIVAKAGKLRCPI